MSDIANLPTLTYYSVSQKDSISIESYSDQKLIIYFIDTACDFCAVEVKELMGNQELLKDIEVVLVGSNADSHFLALDSTNLELWQMDSLVFLEISKPTSFVLNKGIIKAKNEGWTPLKKMISQVEKK